MIPYRRQAADYIHDCVVIYMLRAGRIDTLCILCYNTFKKGGGVIKKVVSIFFFVLMIAVFIFELYFGIAGAIDVNNAFAELEDREASGHEYLGVGLDVLVIGVCFLSIVGFVISLVSCKIAQSRVVRIVSVGMCSLFLLPIFVCSVILML